MKPGLSFPPSLPRPNISGKGLPVHWGLPVEKGLWDSWDTDAYRLSLRPCRQRTYYISQFCLEGDRGTQLPSPHGNGTATMGK